MISNLTIHYSPLSIFYSLFIFAIPSPLSAQLPAGIGGWVILWRERCDGSGIPGGLPLIIRFSSLAGWVGRSPYRNPRELTPLWNGEPSSSSTLFRDFRSLDSKSMRCLSRVFFRVPPFLDFRDYTVKNRQPFSGWRFLSLLFSSQYFRTSRLVLAFSCSWAWA